MYNWGMKTATKIFVTLFLVLQYGCADKRALVPSHYYAKIYLQVDESVDEEKLLHLYLNQKDINRTIEYSKDNVIYLQKRENNIQLVQTHKTADISLEVEKGSQQYFKLLQTYNNSLIIVQMQTK